MNIALMVVLICFGGMILMILLDRLLAWAEGPDPAPRQCVRDRTAGTRWRCACGSCKVNNETPSLRRY